MKTIIKGNQDLKIIHHTGKTRFRGCQCIRDCTCNEDFKSSYYDYYTVFRMKNTGKSKTTVHNTLSEAENRYNYLLGLL